MVLLAEGFAAPEFCTVESEELSSTVVEAAEVEFLPTPYPRLKKIPQITTMPKKKASNLPVPRVNSVS